MTEERDIVRDALAAAKSCNETTAAAVAEAKRCLQTAERFKYERDSLKEALTAAHLALCEAWSVMISAGVDEAQCDWTRAAMNRAAIALGGDGNVRG